MVSSSATWKGKEPRIQVTVKTKNGHQKFSGDRYGMDTGFPIMHMNCISYPLIQFRVEMVNFMCQPVWATGYPAIWLNIMAGSVRMFLDEMNTGICRLSKIVCLPQSR